MDLTIAPYTKEDFAQFEAAIAFASLHLHKAGDLGKPVLLHSIRVGLSLAKQGYPVAVVLAGFLHDTVEDTSVDAKVLAENFGLEVAALVAANSKDASITDREARHKELMKRCVAQGQEAAIVKAADILDNFAYYTALKDPLVDYCKNNVALLKQYMPESFDDPIFETLFTTVQ